MERLESGGRCVPGIVSFSQPRPHPQRASPVSAGVEHTKEEFVFARDVDQNISGQYGNIQPYKLAMFGHLGGSK